MRLVAAVAVLCVGLGVGCAAQAASERLVHRYLDVEISPNGELVASVEGDSSKSGGAPTVRDLLIRHVSGGTAITIPMPCGRVAECWPDSPTWSPDGKHLSFALRTPGSHARSLYTVGADGGGLAKLLGFSGTIGRLRYLPDGRLAMLAIQNLTKEVGATHAGAAIAGMTASPGPRWKAPPKKSARLKPVRRSPAIWTLHRRSSELRFWSKVLCGGSRRRIYSSTSMTGARAAKGSSAPPLPATATTIGGRRNCMPSPKAARVRALFIRQPMLGNSLRCRRCRATVLRSRLSRAS